MSKAKRAETAPRRAPRSHSRLRAAQHSRPTPKISATYSARSSPIPSSDHARQDTASTWLRARSWTALALLHGTTSGGAGPSPADHCFSAIASACWSPRAALRAPRMAARCAGVVSTPPAESRSAGRPTAGPANRHLRGASHRPPSCRRGRRRGVARFDECREGAGCGYRTYRETRKFRKDVSGSRRGPTCNARKAGVCSAAQPASRSSRQRQARMPRLLRLAVVRRADQLAAAAGAQRHGESLPSGRQNRQRRQTTAR